MITEELWEEIKGQPQEVLWKLIKELTHTVRADDRMDEFRELLCLLLEILDLNRRIQKLEAEREVVNRLLAEPKES